MLILALCCALVVGWAAGGRLSRWEAAGLRALPLPVNVTHFDREGHIVALCREKGSADAEFIPFCLL